MTAGTVAPRKSMAPWLKDEVEYYDFQIEDIRKMAGMNNFLLGSQMGLGKSLQALTVFIIDVMRKRAETLLIVCPVSLRGNWANELEKFTTLPYIRLGEERHPWRRGQWRSVSAEERITQIQEFRLGMDGPRVMITNYEQVVSLGDKLGKFDMLIVDEAHNIKTPESQRTMAVHAIKRKRVGLLSGTPILNRVDELWSLLHMIDPRKYPNPDVFRYRYCKFGGFAGRTVVGAKNVQELNRKVAEVMIRRMKREVLDLKEPFIQKIFVDLSPHQQELYDQLNDDLKFPDENGDLQDIENSLEIFMRLLEICDSSATVPRQPDHSNKLDRLVDDAMDVIREGDKPIIFTRSRKTHALLVARFAKAGCKEIAELHGDVKVSDRQYVIDLWSSQSKPVPIVCMSQVAGVGLNMTASHDVFFAGKGYVPGLHDQAIDRVDRIGQTEPVHVREYITKSTVEERIEILFKMKRGTFTDVVENSVAFAKVLAILKQEEGQDSV